MIAYEIEGGRKETSEIRRVGIISDSPGVSVILSDVEVGMGVSRICGWLRITLVIDYTDAGATSVGVAGVIFDAESMRFIAEVPSLAV